MVTLSTSVLGIILPPIDIHIDIHPLTLTVIITVALITTTTTTPMPVPVPTIPAPAPAFFSVIIPRPSLPLPLPLANRNMDLADTVTPPSDKRGRYRLLGWSRQIPPRRDGSSDMFWVRTFLDALDISKRLEFFPYWDRDADRHRHETFDISLDDHLAISAAP